MQCPIFLEKGSFRLTSAFGVMRTRDNGTTYPHGGTDGTRDGATATYIDPIGGFKCTGLQTNIKGTEDASGNYFELYKLIDGHTVKWRVKHCSYGSIPLVLGQITKQGDKLGYMGNTGHSTSAHAHVELVIDGEYVDAYPWLSGKTDILGRPIQGDDEMGYPELKEDEYINAERHPVDSVTKLQQILKYKYGYEVLINGLWTDTLVEAVKAYQADNSLGVDGRCGPATIISLNRDLYEEVKELRANNEKSKQTEQNCLKEMARIQSEMGKLAEERNAVKAKLDGIKTAADIIKSI